MPGYAPASWVRLSRSASTFPSRLPADLEVDPLRPPVRQRHQVLGAGLGPANRRPDRARQIGDQHVLAAKPLAAEAAADVRGDHPDLGRIGPEDRRERVAVLVRRLGREPRRQPVVVLDSRGGRARLDRARGDPLARDRPRCDHVASGEQLLVGDRGLALRADVRPASSNSSTSSLIASTRVGHDRQRLVIDLDQLGRVDAQLAGRREHDSDDLSGESDLVDRQEHPVPAVVDSEERGRWLLAELDVVRREDPHVRVGLGPRRVDRIDPRVGPRRAHERAHAAPPGS